MRQRQRQRGESRRQRQQHHRGPEQQKKGQAGRSLRQQARGLQQHRRRRQQRLGRSEQRQAGTRGCSRGSTAAAARQRESPTGAAVAQPDGAGTSRAGAAAVAGRGRASQAAASSFPAAGRRAPTSDIAAAERLGRRLAEVAEATVAAPEAPLILSQKEKEAGLPVSQRQRQRQCCSRRADWRKRQEQWQRTMCIGGKLGKATHLRRNLRRMMGRCATLFFAGYEGSPRALHGVPLIPLQPALQTRRSSFLRAAVAPNLRYKRQFPAHGCACYNAALSSLVLLACDTCSTAPCPR